MDEIVHYGGEQIPQGHKDEFDPNAPVDSKTKVNQELKILIQVKLLPHQWMM